MGTTNGGWSRRGFLNLVGRAGGAAAVYETMTALGWINQPLAFAGPARLPEGSGSGKSVVVLGAGLGGLLAAYELDRAGYSVLVLEAQDRAGGRSLTARRGTEIHEESERHGRTRQVARLDEGLYLNLGPGRIPYHHRRVIHYCQELDVALEVYVMESTANLFQTPAAWGGQHQLNRRIANDTRGYIAELLAKAVRRKALDSGLDEDDEERLLSLLRAFGDLGQRSCDGDRCDPLVYCGSTRSGCGRGPSVTEACCPEPKLDLKELLRSEFWLHRFYQPQDFLWQPTLFQPVGGMDQIVEGFKRRIGHLISYQSEVQEIRLDDDGVDVIYRDRLTGEGCRTRADLCLSNIPLPVLQQIPANFSSDFKAAVDRGRFAATCKVGWQANRRFWETDDEIYGGISWIDDIITQMWYPSNDYFSKRGTLTGTYNFDELDGPQYATEMGNMSLAERLAVARQGALRLHPKAFGDDHTVPQELGLSIAWQNVPFQRGGWAEWENTPEDRKAYTRLLAPDPLRHPRFWVLGDQISHLPGWQEGAMMSAEHVLSQIGLERVDRLEIEESPVTRRLVDDRF